MKTTMSQFCTKAMLPGTRLEATALKARREISLLIQPHLQENPATRLVVDWIVQQFSGTLQAIKA